MDDDASPADAIGARRPEADRMFAATQEVMLTYFAHAGVEVFMKDLEGRYLLVNDNFQHAWGRSGDDLIGRTDFDVIDPETAARYQAEDRRVVETNAAVEIEGHDLREDGEHLFRVVKFPIHDAEGAVVGIGGVATDMTETLRSRDALALSEEQFRLAFLHASEGIAIVSLDNVVVQVNDRLCEILGITREDVVGTRAGAFDHPDNSLSFTDWARRLQRNDHSVIDRMLSRPDGSIAYTRLSTAIVRGPDGEPSHYVTMITDETERHELERRARQAEKLEAVGQLAGGIAHDINNLLGGILGYAELVRAAQTDPAVIEQCEQVIAASVRAADYTTRLLTFARPTEHATELVTRNFAREVIIFQRYELGLMDAYLGRMDAERGDPDREVMGWMGTPMPLADMPGLAGPEEMDALRDARGVDADILFLELMIEHHRGGVHMAEDAAVRATAPEVRRLADYQARTQRAEIEEYERALARLRSARDAGEPAGASPAEN